ncbi:5-methyltetrahydropteroyltriglutamate--homocysteine S-methyltransferase [Catalinimonas alkaloidigena]|nr:5-methyltetrahydropteroyltriglutamate--homocysteine S-methyltransferase [Catalinimonas alkaloidigena]
MTTHLLGYPRLGARREMKRACEQYWAGKASLEDLREAGRAQRHYNWSVQQQVGLDWLPVNDFSFYDQVLDTSLMVGAVPERFHFLREGAPEELLFAMARGYQQGDHDVIALEMTKWFDTNYHYLVPEFTADESFSFFSTKVVDEFREAQALGHAAKPVLVGPVSYLLLGKAKDSELDRLSLLERLLPVYAVALQALQDAGAEWVQLDEPFLAMDLCPAATAAYSYAYRALRRAVPELKLLVATYFGDLRENQSLALSLPVDALHLDLVRGPEQLASVLAERPEALTLSLGLVDGRNVWKNDFAASRRSIELAQAQCPADKLWLSASCSLLHVPFDLEQETQEDVLTPEIKNWLAFAKQKAEEVVLLARLATDEGKATYRAALDANQQAMDSRRQSPLVHRPTVQQRLRQVTPDDTRRQSAFPVRQAAQHARFHLPYFPTTTIGSFPQTPDVRRLRAQLRRGDLTLQQYEATLEEKTRDVIHRQEALGLDVLVHGEYERNDMVEYFGEQLDGITFTEHGWVQSYGSRGVKPPIIFGDVERPQPMTVRWADFAQQQTDKPVKGMLTGPITILQWSFVRNDQPRRDTARQIALAIREEVVDLERAHIGIIQIDEPALREGLPLRRADWPAYLDWSTEAFRLAASGVRDDTQIHTHMCYSEFNDILDAIAALDADVITVETSRSQMELLEAFAAFAYPNEIGPGVYDIHSPRVPTAEEMQALMEKAARVIPARNLWVNPDCGLKTRGWPETEAALRNMVLVARQLREEYAPTLL